MVVNKYRYRTSSDDSKVRDRRIEIVRFVHLASASGGWCDTSKDKIQENFTV